MARNWGNSNWSNQSNNNWRGNNNNQQQQKQPFDLNQWAQDMVDIYALLKAKADEAGLEIPADALARWTTSGKISLDK